MNLQPPADMVAGMPRELLIFAAIVVPALAALWLKLESDALAIAIIVAAAVGLALAAGPRAPPPDVFIAALMTALQHEASRPVVTVRSLEHKGEYSAPLYDTLPLFRAAVARAARVEAATLLLYWFPRSPAVLAERQPLKTEASYSAFRQQQGLLEVWVFVQRDGVPTPPATLTIGGDDFAVDAPAIAVAAPAASDDGSRLSTMQLRFRTAVICRDGNACVLCGTVERAGGGKTVLEAAHVVAVRTPESVVASVELMNRFDTMNGITLCMDCHHYFVRHLWRVVDGTVDVADALVHRVGCERWAVLHGRALRVPATPGLREQWPPARLWSVQSVLFEAARDKRHAAAEGKPFLCDVCCRRSSSEAALAVHKCHPARLFATPAVRRIFPAAADGGRRLLFDGEGDEGEDSADDSSSGEDE